MNLFVVATMLLVGAGALAGFALIGAARQRASIRARFSEAVGADAVPADTVKVSMWQRLLEGFGRRPPGGPRRESGSGREPGDFDVLLHRAGWPSRGARSLFRSVLIVAPVFTTSVALGWVWLADVMDAGRGWLGGVFVAFVVGFVAPRMAIRTLANARGMRLSRESPFFCRLLAMALDSGLTLEQAFRTLAGELHDVLRESRTEITWVLRRIDAGASVADTLTDWRKLVGVPEISDLANLLLEITRFGGNARGSLIALARSIEERQLASVKEQINKLTVKMTVVMTVLLFPALLVVLAGPGILALLRGLSHVAR